MEKWVAWKPGPRNDTSRPQFLTETGELGPISSARHFEDYVAARRALGWPEQKWAGQPITLQAALDDDRYWQEEQIEIELVTGLDTVDIRLVDHYAGLGLEINFARYADGVRLDGVRRFAIIDGLHRDGYYLDRYHGIGRALALLFSASQVAGAIMEKENIYPRNEKERNKIWTALGRLEDGDEG